MLLNKTLQQEKKSFIEELKTFPLRKKNVTFFSGRASADIYNIRVFFLKNFLARCTHFLRIIVTKKIKINKII